MCSVEFCCSSQETFSGLDPGGYIVFCSVLSVPINLLLLVIFTIKITF